MEEWLAYGSCRFVSSSDIHGFISAQQCAVSFRMGEDGWVVVRIILCLTLLLLVILNIFVCG